MLPGTADTILVLGSSLSTVFDAFHLGLFVAWDDLSLAFSFSFVVTPELLVAVLLL